MFSMFLGYVSPLLDDPYEPYRSSLSLSRSTICVCFWARNVQQKMREKKEQTKQRTLSPMCNRLSNWPPGYGVHSILSVFILAMELLMGLGEWPRKEEDHCETSLLVRTEETEKIPDCLKLLVDMINLPPRT